MTTTFSFQPSLRNNERPMWALEDAGRVMRLGDRRVDLADVAGFERHSETTSYRHGRVLAALAFALLAAWIFVGIVALGAPSRYTVAYVILLALAAMCLQDVYLANPSRMIRFTVRTRSGAAIPFATADAASADALAAVLSQRT